MLHDKWILLQWLILAWQKCIWLIQWVNLNIKADLNTCYIICVICNSAWWHHHHDVLLVFSTANQSSLFMNPLQVGTNGYFSFGTRQTVYRPSLFSSTSTPNYLVAPFWADINTNIHGSISYEVHTTSAGSSSTALLNRVNTFITNQQNIQFSGTWMLMASWNQVSQLGGSSSVVSSLHGHMYFLSDSRYHPYPEESA